MKIKSLHISNFRGIVNVSLEDLGTMVIIAGQNGSGKSCIFDAIRLLKSVYGGYQHNEWQQWLGEFQINLNHTNNFLPIFNDRSKTLNITCEFTLSEQEKQYITNSSRELLKEHFLRTSIQESYGWISEHSIIYSPHYRDRAPEITKKIDEHLPILLAELSSPSITGSFIVAPDGEPFIPNSLVLSIAFSTFKPKHIGVIDYHGAQRHYGRENIQGVNLNFDNSSQQHGHHALYNYGNKYTNVKGEIASSYIKEVLTEQAGIPKASQLNLTNTLNDLFKTFFPDKKFLGPTPTTEGALTFPVKTANGNIHDLDELSSGEKEILYGYLRIRNSAPKFSIILLDEPELHLNPRLIRNLPSFYRQKLGEDLENQIWLVTHSDALLREVVGQNQYSVFHMTPQSSNTQPDSNQLRQLKANVDLDIALTDLVGDLAAYNPEANVVIVEGGGDSDFDKRVIGQLFPDFCEKVTLISGTNKTKVKSLLEILENAKKSKGIDINFFSITDKDSDEENTHEPRNSFKWDVYHIENYLLEASYIAKVIKNLSLGASPTDEEIWDDLKNCAKETTSKLTRHELSVYTNEKIINAIKIKTDPQKEEQSIEISGSLKNSIGRLNALEINELSYKKLKERENEIKDRLSGDLADGTWRKSFMGREILKKFISKKQIGLDYNHFRNLIISQMREDNFKPEGMRKIIGKIESMI